MTPIHIYIESIYARVKLNVRGFQVSPHVSNINGKTREIYDTARPWRVKEINESVYSHSLNLQLFFHQSYCYRVDNKYFIAEITMQNTTVKQWMHIFTRSLRSGMNNNSVSIQWMTRQVIIYVDGLIAATTSCWNFRKSYLTFVKLHIFFSEKH